MGRNERLSRKSLESVNETALQGQRHMQLWLFERHQETFVGLGSHPTELQKHKKVLERQQAAPMPPCRQRKTTAFMGLVQYK